MTASRRSALLQEIGIGPQWQLRHRAVAAVPEALAATAAGDPEALPVASDETVAIAGMDWAQLQQAVAVCRRC
ncbi:MAG TPA: uracil-DNA glycosylase, partial [Burkholderiaceae bacterium]|nr:uracil-DNA glycosylase [Burkholderiaceae bacterium]